MGTENTSVTQALDLATQAFNLVASTRQKRQKRTLRATFAPLSEEQVLELRRLVREASSRREIRLNRRGIHLKKTSREITSLRKALEKADAATNYYIETPKTSDATIWTEHKKYSGTGFYRTGVIKSRPNPEKPRALLKMQRQVYKALKPQVGK